MTDSAGNTDQRMATDLANRLVWLSSQLQRWSSQRTPSTNPYHLNFSQVSALYLVRYGISTPGSLAKIMMVTPRAATALVDVLEQHHLLVRQADPHDRRLVRLEITPAGEALSRDVENQALRPLVDVIGGLEDSDQTALEHSLRTLQTIFGKLQIPS